MKKSELPDDDARLNKIRRDLLMLFKDSIGWTFRVKGTPLTDTIEGVDEKKKMVCGKHYGDFHIDLCELVSKEENKSLN